MAQITVTASQLRAVTSELRELNTQYKAQVSNLESTEGTLNSQWKGAAKDAFHRAFTTDATKMTEFSTIIEQYCVALEQIALKYEQAETQNIETAISRTY